MDLETNIQCFDSCSLADLNLFEFDKRTDTKFVFNSKLVPQLVNSLNSDYKLLYVDEDWYFNYKNTYFDSNDFIHYRAHHSGKANRKKVRTRQYGDNGIIFFELKHKSNKGETDKTRIPVAPFTSFPEVPKTFYPNNWFNVLSNKIHVDYTRLTFLNQLTHQKLTIDFDLTARFNDHQVSFENVAIAEVKQLKSSAKSAAMLFFKEQYIRPVSFSKYCISLALLNSTLKSNRFKPVIHQLNKISTPLITTYV